MDQLLLKLLGAHFLGDFFLQPDSWVVEKESKKLRSLKLYLHILIHGLLSLLLVWDVRFWKQILFIMITHGLIDSAKLIFQSQQTKQKWFFADQVLHLAVIIGVWYSVISTVPDWTVLQSPELWAWLLAILFLANPSSIIIKNLIARWTPVSKSFDKEETNTVTSLQSAGKYIGIMERFLVLIFASNNHWEAIGFLIAAKSIFRFGDLKEGNDLKLTEYILIGTLLSFGIAILVALLMQFALKG